MEQALEGGTEPPALLDDPLTQCATLTGDYFGGGRGGWGSVVGDVVGNGVVDLVADGGDDGFGRLVDGAGDGFVVEGPEVFRCASAAPDDENVDIVELVEVGDSPGYFRGGLCALDPGRA